MGWLWYSESEIESGLKDYDGCKDKRMLGNLSISFNPSHE